MMRLEKPAHFHAEGMSSASFRHGPFEMIGPDVFVVACDGSPVTAELNARMAEYVPCAGGRAALVRTADDIDAFAIPFVSETAQPILEILPAQMISLALAQLRGHPAGVFEHGRKTTTVE
jgi:glutamine---fructose-6-phosphate transaminase (isomerizing)